MSKSNPQSRKCSVCGQEKPLMAFLQQGGGYGSVCATCKVNQAGESDERGSTSKGLRLDDKVRVQAELEQKRRAKEQKILDHEELDKKYTAADDLKQKKETKVAAEKDHRENYLKVTLPPIRSDEATKKKAQDAHKQKNAETTFVTTRKQEQTTAQQIQTIEKENRITNDVDLTAPFLGPQIAFAKIHNPHFLKWLKSSALLKTSPALMSTFEKNAQPSGSHSNDPKKAEPTQADNKQQDTQLKQTKTTEQLFSTKPSASPTQSAKETAATSIHQIENAFGPSSRKR